MMPEPPAFESHAAEVEWVVVTTLKTEAARGEAYRACDAKHQKVVEALQDCANQNTPAE